MAPDFSSPVESQDASSVHLTVALIFLVLTFIVMVYQYFLFIRKTKSTGYKIYQSPFLNYFLIYSGLLMIIINELEILISIIITNQEVTYFGREKSIFIVTGLGLFIIGWTRVVLFNLALKGWVNTAVKFAFTGSMLFYLFALIMTILITFDVLHDQSFAGLGYGVSVAIYGTFLIIDLIAMGVIALKKRSISKYQAWIGLLLFSALFLNFLSIIFNVIPLIIVNKVDPQIHAFFNYIIEPFMYFITTALSFRILYWVLFNPQWLTNRTIEASS